MEPIRVNRHTGQIISAPTYTSEQLDILWTGIAKALVANHPELFLPGQEVTDNAEPQHAE